MAAQNLKKIYKKDPGTIVKQMDAELILLPLGDGVQTADLGAFYILRNSTSRFIWGLIDGKKSVADILERVLDVFDVDRRTAESGIACFLGELSKIKAIV